MNSETKQYEERLITARMELHAAQTARAREVAAAAAKGEAERIARAAEDRVRLMASLSEEERAAQALLVRLSKADPHGHNEQNAELAQWKGELSKTIRRFEFLRSMELVRDEEIERIASQPRTRTLPMRFLHPSDFAIVVVDAVEAHHRAIAAIEAGSPQRWRVPAMCFVGAGEADAARAILEGEKERRHSMGLRPATFATLLSPEQWADPFVVARAAGVEPSDGKDAWCGAWLDTMTNDERVTALWTEGRHGAFIDAIERKAIEAANSREHVGNPSAGRAFWRLRAQAEAVAEAKKKKAPEPTNDTSAEQAVST